MNIKDFVTNFKNHPVLFIGTGISLRYLENSFTWDELLKKISYDLKENEEFYLDIKSECLVDGKFKYDKIASIIEDEFNSILKRDRNGKFKEVNDIFYENMERGITLSRFKIFISLIFSKLQFRSYMSEEIESLKKTRKNIGSIITTNYDKLIENIFEFNPLIGNNILLSNPYGALYKIHGCCDQANKIIITKKDYEDFDKKYELIRAQLLSLFIHNPIIFIGYNIADENIKNILKTIFTYIEPNSLEAEKIRSNFLLVEYSQGSNNQIVTEHDIDMEGFSTIRINKIKTDDYVSIYKALSDLQLPISAMDIRKVQNIVKEIYSGGNIKVSFTEDLENLENKDKVVAIGSTKTINYSVQNYSELIRRYFKIIEEENIGILAVIDDIKIQSSQYFPIFGFGKINNKINCLNHLKLQQYNKINLIKEQTKSSCKTNNKTIKDIYEDENIPSSYKENAIIWSVLEKKLNLDDVEEYLKNITDTTSTNFKKILCAYDYVKYSDGII